jgi:N4-gp56 family major capsid protein
LLDDRNVNDQGIDASGAVISDGNLYGSSRDIGVIKTKLPHLSETGGRVNRVGFTRVIIEAELTKLGFFDEFTQEALDFDNENDLMGHITRESLRGANEIVEDCLQMDLLEGAGIIYYGGEATSDDEVTGEDGAVPSVLDYDLLMKLDTELNNNLCPKHTKIITGTRYIDTRVINSARYIYVGSEMLSTIYKMTDYHGNPAFVPVQHYAAAGNTANGEIGAIGNFRVIFNPEMQYWGGAGAPVTNNGGYHETNGNYDIHPTLCVGSGSFTTIGFQTNGKSVKFTILTKMPGLEMADRNDPYGETGFYSIKWYYATMILRPEWLGVIKTVAEL